MLPTLKSHPLIFLSLLPLTLGACAEHDAADAAARNNNDKTATVLAPVASPAAGQTYVIQSATTGLVIDVSGASTANGAKLVQNSLSGASGSSSQQWTLQAVGGSVYTLKNSATGNCADLYNGNLQQWACNGGGTEQWSLQALGNNAYALTNVSNGLAASTVGTSPGTVLQGLGTSSASHWYFTVPTAVNTGLVPTATPATGTSYVVQSVGTGLVIDVMGSSAANGASLIQNNLSGAAGSSAQQWTLLPVGAKTFSLKNTLSGKCMDMYAGKLQQWDCNGGSTEQWSLSALGGDAFALVNSGNGVTASTVGWAAGTVLQGLNQSSASAWYFSTASTSGGTGGSGGVSGSPATLANGVVYQVYVNIFSPAGNFAGVTARLSSLHALGVNIVYLMPITPNSGAVAGHGFFGPLGSPYAVQDYYAINPNFGSAADLQALLSTAHGLGMKVIVDQVLNHTGWSNGLLAAHPEWYAHSSSNAIENGAYWSSFPWADTAQLEYYSSNAQSLQSYMISMLTWWLKTYAIDGFRFDTASYNMSPVASRPNIPVSFWQSVGTALRAINPNVLLLGEELDAGLALAPFTLDYGWNFYNAVASALSQGYGVSNMQAQYASQQPPNFPASMTHLNIIENWDKAADYNAFGGFAQARAAAVINALLPGVPMLFNGEEAGNTNFGSGNGDNTMMPIAWSGSNASAMTSFYTSLLALRGANSAFQNGSLSWVNNTSGDQVLSFTRSDAAGKFLVLVNVANATVSGTLSGLPSVSGWTDVSPQGSLGGTAHLAPPSFSLQPHDFAVMRAH